MKRTIAVLICILMLIPSAVSYANDYKGHWAEDAINQLIDKNIISGNSDGSINPEGYITRAEFVKITNRVFGYTVEATEQFPDVSSDKWYANEFKIAKNAGYIAGDNNGNANPEKHITRAEVCVAWSRALKLNTINNANTGFNDDFEIASWAKGAINAMKSISLISGYEDNTFRSTANMKRCEIFSVSSRILKDPTLLQPVSVGVTSTPGVSKAPSSGGGGGGGGGASAPSGSLSAPSNLHWLESSHTVRWNSVPNAISYVVTVEITTPDTKLIWTKPAAEIQGTEYNLKADIEELMNSDISENRKRKETFRVSVAAKNHMGISPLAILNDIEWTNSYIDFPEIDFEQKTNADGSEEIALVFTPDENALNYKVEIDFDGEGSYTEILCDNGKASLSSEQIGKIKGLHNVRISAPSKDSQKYLSLKEMVTEINLPLYAKEEDGIKYIGNQRHFSNMAVNNTSVDEYKLLCDLTLKNHTSFDFNATLDGDNKTVTLDNLNNSLFGINKGIVKNLKFEGNATFTVKDSGIVAGNNQGTITNCENRATVISSANRSGAFVGYNQSGTLSYLRNYADLTFSASVTGGICGYSTSKILGCVNYGDITLSGNTSGHGGIVANHQITFPVENSANFGNITANGTANEVGGIIGQFCSMNTTAARNCMNAGDITLNGTNTAAGIMSTLSNEKYDNVKLENCYNSGKIIIGGTDYSNVYGLYNKEAAGVEGTTVINGYYLISGDSEGKGASTGLTDSQMKLSLFFEGFDFANVWFIDSENKLFMYPQLTDAPHYSEPVKLSAPSYVSGKEPRNNGSAVEFMVEIDEGTKEITAGIFENGSIIGTEKLITVTEGITEYDISFELSGLTVGNTYTIKVSAKGDGVYYLDSDEFVDDSYIHRNIVLAAPELSELIWVADDSETSEAEDEAYCVSWASVESVGETVVSGYKVYISDGINTESEIVNGTSYKIKADNPTFADKTVTVKVIAVNSLNEDISTGLETEPINLKYALPVTKEDVVYQGIGNKRHFDNMEAAGNYIVTNNFEMSGYTSKTSFSGVLDGDGKTVTLNGTVSLFSAMSGTIRNLITDGSVSLTASKSAIYVGINSGLIKNCKNYATLTTASSHNAVFAGQNNKTVTKCFNYADLTFGQKYSGGIAGYNIGTVEYCGNEGNITGRSIDTAGVIGQHQGSSKNIVYCYNTGDVTAEYNTGGIIGNITTPGIKLENCFNTGKITAVQGARPVAGIAALIGKTNVQILNSYNTGSIISKNTDVSVSGAFFHTVTNDASTPETDTCNLINCCYLDKDDAGTAKEGSVSKSEQEINEEIQDLLSIITSSDN